MAILKHTETQDRHINAKPLAKPIALVWVGGQGVIPNLSPAAVNQGHVLVNIVVWYKV